MTTTQPVIGDMKPILDIPSSQPLDNNECGVCGANNRNKDPKGKPIKLGKYYGKSTCRRDGRWFMDNHDLQ
ncbi:unnamed protein product, partial [Oppiella nova]